MLDVHILGCLTRNKTLQSAQNGLDINFNTNDNNTRAKNYKGRVYVIQKYFITIFLENKMFPFNVKYFQITIV